MSGPQLDLGADRAIGAATSFEALSTYVYVATRRAEELPLAEALATRILRDVDETCSRFRQDSDLSLVNRRAGRPVEVDPLLIAAVRVAISAADQTLGLVNPLLGRPLAHLGYDRDFGEIREIDNFTEIAPTPLPPPPSVDAWQDIEIDAGTLRIPPDTALDLGATGKAWAADIIANAFHHELTSGALISVGGDIAIAHSRRAATAQNPWPIAISEHPGAAAEETITLSHGGLATSSIEVRHWARGGVRRHHLLDPRTGLPCPEVWRTVTATGPSCTAANIASTAAIVHGHDAVDWLSAHSVTARLVDAQGRVHRVGAWGTDG